MAGLIAEMPFMLPPGYLHFYLSRIIFLFTKVNSLMPFVYSMTLHCHCYYHTVCVAKILPCPMPLAAHISSTMKYVTQMLVWWWKCAMMFRWGPTYILCLVRLCDTTQQWLMIMPEWIWEHPIFGGAFITAPISIFVFSILVQPPLVLPPWLQLSIDVRLISVMLTQDECMKLSVAALPL